MDNTSLFLSRDPELDYLSALEFGRLSDGQPRSYWRPVSAQFAYLVPKRARRAKGFFVRRFDTFDEDAPEVEAIWHELLFAVPLLGLTAASAGEVIVAARAHFGDEPSINRVYFDAATHLQGEKALAAWRCCLECGDGMAHFALGYTLYELGRYREAYAHLRLYTELSPNASWNWCWLGKAASAIGERTEAERAYRRAIELTAEGDEETEAPELLAHELRDVG